MIDSDLAALYGVETRTLVQAVKRNGGRFPDDFMFQLSKEELDNWRSQIVISNPGTKMGLRYAPSKGWPDASRRIGSDAHDPYVIA